LCMPAHSTGPKGGNCDRLPGCGHDAGLPFCEVDAMEARCANVSGCTQFNTNGYLYSGSTSVAPFSEYPLECWSFEGPPGLPSLVNVTLDVVLTDGLLGYSISFDSNGTLSLWDYTVSISKVKTTKTTRALVSKSSSTSSSSSSSSSVLVSRSSSISSSSSSSVLVSRSSSISSV
jgi:hypothetical protein